MLGFIVGTFCLVGLAKLTMGPRCHGPNGHRMHGPPHGWGGHPGRRGRGRGRGRRKGFDRAAAERLKRRLDVDEDQEDLVDLALKDLRQATRDFKRTLHDGRTDLAEAFADDEVDAAALAALFSTQDEEIARFRREAVSALKQLHAVLEPDQREEAVRLLARAGRFA